MSEVDARVSVILPYFNRADTLERAAQSVLNQTHSNLVLYLVNDGSSDNSRAVARSLRDERVRHIDLPENQGVCRARNAGLDAASTDLIAFMDSDDEWLPKKLEHQIAELRDLQARGENVSVLGCGWSFAGSQPNATDFLPGPFNRLQMLAGVRGTGTPMLLVNRARATESAAFDPAFPALVERDFVLSCLANDSLLAVLPELLVTVNRGRSDHVANPINAAAAWELYLSKYARELSNDQDLLSFYHYRAAREHLVARQPGSASSHVRPALGSNRVRRSFHLSLGLPFGIRGLAVAQKLLPL